MVWDQVLPQPPGLVCTALGSSHKGSILGHVLDERESCKIEQTKMTTSTAQTHSSIPVIYLEYFNASARF